MYEYEALVLISCLFEMVQLFSTVLLFAQEAIISHLALSDLVVHSFCAKGTGRDVLENRPELSTICLYLGGALPG